MRALLPHELLEIWEHGPTQSLLERCLALLATARAQPIEDVACLSVGQRDDYLLTLREWAFGPEVSALAGCPACGECLELNFRTSDVRADAERDGTETQSVNVADYQLRLRPPNSLDLIAVAGQPDLAVARRQLLGRCLSEIRRESTALAVEEVPEEVLNTAVQHMGQADPQADIQLSLRCPHCRHQWQADFDIGPFFWNEIHAWALRTLREVHTLASAYGWREQDILAMTPWRRQFYLNCIGA